MLFRDMGLSVKSMYQRFFTQKMGMVENARFTSGYRNNKLGRGVIINSVLSRL